MEKLSDLEAVALGIIRETGGCTAYAVRKQLARSPSARFSNSAGSIYPLISRLEQRGLIRCEDRMTGRRPARVCRCTQGGLVALRRWLGVPADPRGSMTDDPLRTRLYFLASLPRARRREWLDRAEESLARQMDLARAYDAGLDDDAVFARIASDNAVRQIRSRREWLAGARRKLARAGMI